MGTGCEGVEHQKYRSAVHPISRATPKQVLGRLRFLCKNVRKAKRNPKENRAHREPAEPTAHRKTSCPVSYINAHKYRRPQIPKQRHKVMPRERAEGNRVRQLNQLREGAAKVLRWKLKLIYSAGYFRRRKSFLWFISGVAHEYANIGREVALLRLAFCWQSIDGLVIFVRVFSFIREQAYIQLEYFGFREQENTFQ